MTEGCGHQIGDVQCDRRPARLYGPGPRCKHHTPAAIAGRDEPVPDPDLTLDAMRSRARFRVGGNKAASGLIDDRAVASGRRRATNADYRAARKREDERRKTRG